ncbi:MAG TPA: class I SAM-dependent methyltransferase, partial [Actinomycetota bacterium]|nr:class I SAM-dependent methyltransferase [Actinomycetota bacterium]
GYRALAGRQFERAIELGCGPFTNLRLILPLTETKHVHLLDPLIEDYVSHPQCRYRGGRLGGVLSLPSPGSLWAWRRPVAALRELVTSARVGGLRGRPVQLEATSIEDFHPRERFDLVVMINVLEHCRDVDAVLAAIEQLLAPEGTFVFHDRFVPSRCLERTVEEVYDAGHPIRIERSVLDDFLKSRFDAEFRSEFRDLDTFGGREFEVSSVYFIGRREGVPAAGAR